MKGIQMLLLISLLIVTGFLSPALIRSCVCCCWELGDYKWFHGSEVVIFSRLIYEPFLSFRNEQQPFYREMHWEPPTNWEAYFRRNSGLLLVFLSRIAEAKYGQNFMAPLRLTLERFPQHYSFRSLLSFLQVNKLLLQLLLGALTTFVIIILLSFDSSRPDFFPLLTF